ncbi:Universal stress protein [Actinomadura rubteroloni]|uniref:Universal stress protein n=1 Tax=Actinomadura rubteroloni TaxID=1926885 RepID=A0A2P4URX8_9ACTN|nr:universal stress protein [Actinomadura rubteroloni]POM27796.1 Universal stress protein [Actinomadura rubteroloni]
MGSHVLVGYDGTKESEHALRWAAREARLRRLPLTVCHVWRWPYPDSYVDADTVTIVKRMADHILDQGVALAHDAVPAVRIVKRLLDGPPYAALMHEAQTAEVIVVGSHQPGGVPLGSTSIRLAATAHCPVLVVRDRAETFSEVVVGVDGSAASDAALAFAYEEATLRGWSVRAVYGSWEPSAAPNGDLALYGDSEELRRVCGARLERAVAPWQTKFPDVTTRTALDLRPPRETLLEEAGSAGLVVVGNRGVGGLEPLRLGATSSAVLQHAPGTVAVVPPA